MLPHDNILKAMEEYASQSKGYPEEFMEWCIDDYGAIKPIPNKPKNYLFDWKMSIVTQYTLPELYTYWKDNIKDKY